MYSPQASVLLFVSIAIDFLLLQAFEEFGTTREVLIATCP